MKQIHLSRLQNAEHLALINDLYSLLNQANIEALDALKNQLKKGIDQAEAGQLQIRKNEHTQALVSLDDKRDNMYRGLVLRVQSEEFSLTEEVQKAAQKVALVIKTYGNFTLYNYQKETTVIQNFVADLKSSDYLPAVQKIGLEQWVNWLETANNEFHALYTQRRDEYAGQTSYDMKNIRKEIDDTFRKIMQTIDALAILQPSEALATLIAKTNTSIDQWNDTLAQRSGKQGKKNASPTESDSQIR